MRLARRLDELERLFAEREPRIHAFVTEEGRFERLRRQAAELENRYPENDGRPPLFGLLAAVKDIFHVDGFVTRAGARVPPERFSGPQATAVERLLDAGALIVGKAVTTEFAYFGPGPTRNPHALEHTPGGSSSGSAAVVAAGLADLALGTQTIGSVSRPASFCGVVGFKPSYERIPRRGVVPLSPSLDHVGAFARTAPEVRAAAAVLCDDWRTDPSSRRPRLAIPEGPYLERAEEATLELFRLRSAALERAGYQVSRVPVMADFDDLEKRHKRIVAAEAARVHAPWYREFRETYHPKTRALIDAGLQISDEELLQDRAGRLELRRSLTAAMEEHGVDLWLSPAAPGPAPRGLDSTGDPVMNLPWSFAGLPTLALRAGRLRGLPIGVQLAAGWQRDEELLSWGVKLERTFEEATVSGEVPRG